MSSPIQNCSSSSKSSIPDTVPLGLVEEAKYLETFGKIVDEFAESFSENCRNAEICALDLILSTEMPICSKLSFCNYLDISRILTMYQKTWRKTMFTRERAVLLSFLLDFVTCALQDKNILTAYKDCSEKSIETHLNKISSELSTLVMCPTFQCLEVDQMQSLLFIMQESIARLSFSMTPESLRQAEKFLNLFIARKRKQTEKAKTAMFEFNEGNVTVTM